MNKEDANEILKWIESRKRLCTITIAGNPYQAVAKESMQDLLNEFQETVLSLTNDQAETMGIDQCKDKLAKDLGTYVGWNDRDLTDTQRAELIDKAMELYANQFKKH